jgi:4-hydroxybenzoate polyprenyltransferase
VKTLLAVYRLTRAYTAVVAGVVAYALAPGGGIAAMCAAAALALLLAGAFAFNDVYDREADAINVPTRPIPSGVLSARSAIAIAIVCDAGALAAAIATRSSRVLVLTCVLMAMLFAYSLLLKRVTGVKNIVMGLVGASVPLFGSTSPEAAALAITIGLFVLQKEIIADVYDREGDARVGLRTFPVLFGIPRTMAIIAAINVVFVATAGSAALIAVGIANILAAIFTAIRGERAIGAMLTLQKVFLLAGVLFAWRS